MKTNKKPILIFLLLFLVFSLLAQITAYAINVSIDGMEVNFTTETGIPFVDEYNRTQVPLRVTMESFGASVEWDDIAKVATIKYGDSVVIVPINQKYIIKNGLIIYNDSESRIIDSRIYLPIRIVAESFGATVQWQQVIETVIIEKQNNRIIFENGDYYTGDIIDGKPSGTGTYTYTNGTKYIGEFYNGIANGKGELVYSDGTRYIGLFENGSIVGYVEIIYSNGDYFYGQLLNGKRNGKGVYTTKDGNEITGTWSEGTLNGSCTVKYKNGDNYVGNILNKVREGYGVMTFANGDSYAGYWSKDKYSGQGKYTFASGAYYEGQWKENKLNGNGTYCNEYGSLFIGTWVNGVCTYITQ